MTANELLVNAGNCIGDLLEALGVSHDDEYPEASRILQDIGYHLSGETEPEVDG